MSVGAAEAVKAVERLVGVSSDCAVLPLLVVDRMKDHLPRMRWLQPAGRLVVGIAIRRREKQTGKKHVVCLPCALCAVPCPVCPGLCPSLLSWLQLPGAGYFPGRGQARLKRFALAWRAEQKFQQRT